MSKRIERRQVPSEPLALGLHPLLDRIYAMRGVRDASEVDYQLSGLLGFQSLTGIDVAAALLADALRASKRVLVVGDFDADGATSCALAVRGLRMLGMQNVDFLIPNRFDYGYGLTPEIVEVARGRAPDLIVTVDNGISSHEGVEAARSAGIEVLITDHHLPGDTLPNATVIVNPNQPDDHFPSKCIAGVGVMFYVLLATRARLREERWFATAAEPNLATLLDLVALGTVADLVPLDKNNRLLVAQGLQRIRTGRTQCGIQALLRVAGRDPRVITASDLSFAIAPRLNAAGRLTDMSVGVRALLCDKDEEADRLAHTLDDLNQQRRAIESDMHAEAVAILEEMDELTSEGELPTGLCLYNECWHPGVIGIVASRVKASLHRPVIIFAPDADACLRGSARSIDGFHIRDALEVVNAGNPGLILKFGGHAMAAGLTIRAADLQTFRELFNAVAVSSLSTEQLEGVVLSDGALEANQLDLKLADELNRAGPWGQAFPEPMFDDVFRVSQCQLMKDKHLKMTVFHRASQQPLTAIKFNVDPGIDVATLQYAHLAYRLQPNEFRGRRSLNLIVEHMEPCDG